MYNSNDDDDDDDDDDDNNNKCQKFPGNTFLSDLN